MKKVNYDHSRFGFTFVELILAVTIFMMVLTIGYRIYSTYLQLFIREMFGYSKAVAELRIYYTFKSDVWRSEIISSPIISDYSDHFELTLNSGKQVLYSLMDRKLKRLTNPIQRDLIEDINSIKFHRDIRNNFSLALDAADDHYDINLHTQLIK